MDCPAKLNLFNLGLELGYILQMDEMKGLHFSSKLDQHQQCVPKWLLSEGNHFRGSLV